MRGSVVKALRREFARLPVQLRKPHNWRRAKRDARRVRRSAGPRFNVVADFSKAVDVLCAKHRDATIEQAMQRVAHGRTR